MYDVEDAAARTNHRFCVTPATPLDIEEMATAHAVALTDANAARGAADVPFLPAAAVSTAREAAPVGTWRDGIANQRERKRSGTQAAHADAPYE